MIARGDLGVELPIETLPPIQKRLVRQCRDSGKPVIVATQMMESMINSPVPTRERSFTLLKQFMKVQMPLCSQQKVPLVIIQLKQ